MRQMVGDLNSSGATGSMFLGVDAALPDTGVVYSSIPTAFGVTVPKITVNGLRFAQFMDLLCTLLPGLHWGVNADRKIFAVYVNPFDSYLGTLSALNASVAATMSGGKNQVQVSITGSFNADIMLEGGSDGITYGTPIPLVLMSNKASTSYVSNPGEYIANTTGFAYVRTRVITYNWGYISIKLSIAKALTLSEGTDGCVPTFKPATFEKTCNLVDFLLTVPNSSEFISYTVKDQSSIDLIGERALPDVLGYSDVITEIPLGDITYGYSPDMNPVNPNFFLSGSFIQTSSFKFDSVVSNNAWSNSSFVDRLEGSNYNGLDGNFTFTYISSPIDVPTDGYPTALSIYLSATNVGLIRVQAQMDGTEGLYKSMYIESVASPYVTNPSSRKTFFNHRNYESSYITPAQFVRVDPNMPTHVLYAVNAHYPGQTVLNAKFLVSQFKPYRFNVSLLENIAHAYFNTPNADAATVKLNQLTQVTSTPISDIRLNTNLNGIKAAKPKLFKYMWDGKDFGTTVIEFEQAQDATSTSVATLINSKDSKSIATANSFTVNSGKTTPNAVTNTFGTGLQYHQVSESPTSGTPLQSSYAAGSNPNGDHGEWNADKTIGYSGADIYWAALKDIPPNTLIRITIYIEGYDLKYYGVIIAETKTPSLYPSRKPSINQTSAGGYSTGATNTIEVLLDENGHFKIHCLALNGGGGNAMYYQLYFNGLWSGVPII
jgi:hypothetical protein